MWNPQNRNQFEEIIADLMADPDVQALAQMTQHGKKAATRLEHSLYVAYISFLVSRRLRLDFTATTRAALLHDFHFGNSEDGVKRLWQHPHAALENAEKKMDLSDVERDIIVKHMWPLTRPLPSHKETVVVSMADKLCALMEFSRLVRLFRMKKHLAPAVG